MKLQDFILPEKIKFDKDKLSDKYGRFVAEPFERGYGHTIRNSLRRILLSSLEGAAVTAVKIRACRMSILPSKGIKKMRWRLF